MSDFFAKSKHNQVSAIGEFGLCDDPRPLPILMNRIKLNGLLL